MASIGLMELLVIGAILLVLLGIPLAIILFFVFRKKP